ncbi:hypothetical protein OC861_002894 [Tilletia horrida]|nr:hypothetical protein OC861_002894 [Tilletia horrida]
MASTGVSNPLPRNNGAAAVSPSNGSQQPRRVSAGKQHVAPPTLLSKLWKQSKYCLWGAIGTWYLDVPAHLEAVYLHSGFWPSHLVLLSLALLATTVTIFAYLISLPFRGIAPSYSRWSNDPILRTLVPILTLAIVGGFISLTLALSPVCAPPKNINTFVEGLSQAASAAAKSASTAGADLSSESRSLFRKLTLEFSRTFQQTASRVSPPDTAGGKLQAAGASASTAAQLASLDVQSTWRRIVSSTLGGDVLDVQGLATRLGIPAGRAAELEKLLSTYSRQVDALIRGSSASSSVLLGLGSLGWIGAGLGSAATYVLVFGLMGLIGLAAPSPASTQRQRLRKQQ